MKYIYAVTVGDAPSEVPPHRLRHAYDPAPPDNVYSWEFVSGHSHGELLIWTWRRPPAGEAPSAPIAVRGPTGLEEIDVTLTWICFWLFVIAVAALCIAVFK